MENPYKALSKVNPQKEKGHREICNPVFQALINSRLSGAEYQIVLTVIDKTWGFGKNDDLIPYSQFLKATNLSRQSIGIAIKGAEVKHLIVVHRNTKGKTNRYLFNKHYDTWLSSQVNHTSQPLHTSQPNHTKVVNQIIPEVVNQKLSIKRYKETLKEKDQDQGPDSLKEKRKLVFEGLKKRRGYNSGVAGAEAKAITWMLGQGYSVEQMLGCYDRMIKDKFWSDKFLSMPSVQTQIGEFVKGKPKGKLPTTQELKESLKK